ncbi:MAG: PAS domain-containing protein [Planctomycetota bacterium]|jgi:PAS domain S-box-containing protein
MDEKGKPLFMAATAIDITERRKAEEALHREKKFAEDAINAQIDTFFVFNPRTGKAIKWNENFSRISGYIDEEISVMKAPDSYYDQDDLEKANESLRELAATGSATVELSLITKKGKPIPFEYKVSLIEITGGENIAISIGRDITDRKH